MRPRSLASGSLLGLLLAIWLLASGCEQAPAEPAANPRPERPSKAKTQPSATGKIGKPSAISWRKPAAWRISSNPSTMRDATYRVKSVGDLGDAEMSVMRVGGGVLANINRWRDQFVARPKAKINKRQVNGLEVTIVQINGAFRGSGLPSDPVGVRAAFTMLTAIVDTSPARYFFKLTGPAATVAAAREDFDALIDTFAR